MTTEEITILVDNGANCSATNTTKSMTNVREVKIAASTASSSPAVAIHTGDLRIGFQDEYGQKAATSVNMLIIHSLDEPILDTDVRHAGMDFNTKNCKCWRRCMV